MNRHEFLRSLKSELEKNQVQDVPGILADYEEHFTHGLSKGKTEDAIAEGLGDPATISKAYKTEDLISEIKNPETGFKLSLAINVIGRLLLIAPFNFFVLFVPGVVILALLISGWATALAISGVSVAILSVLPVLGTLSANIWAWFATIFTSLGLLGLGVLAGMVMFIVSKFILLKLISYLQWNLRFVLEK
ncbi:hypothetical protein D3C87_162770 [compost metagenome]